MRGHACNFKNLAGKRFGKLTVESLETTARDGRTATYWICVCACGKRKRIASGKLVNGETKSCGCLRIAHAAKIGKMAGPRFALDLSGCRFGRLVAVSVNHEAKPNATGSIVWVCQCDCGRSVDVAVPSLRSGNTRSCGCLRKRGGRKARTPEQATYFAMKQRTLNHSSTAFPCYGGRGITMCKSWLTSFDNFLADMGPKPSTSHTIERLDNDGNYEPGNCIWALRKQQMRNTRHNRMVLFRGKKMAISAWAEELGIPHQRLRSRIGKLGWSVERAFTTP